jgi:thiol:disulfide interchange protein DsbD
MTLSGSPFDYVLAFGGGILVSLTPCIYPLIPITVGLIGGSAGVSKIRGFLLSLSYVTGMAVIYSALGILASLSGSLFGVWSSYPVTNLAVGLVIILFGLSMLDLFAMPQLQFIKLPQVKHGNYFSAFLLGAASGLIVGPCLTPVLGSILLYLAKQKQILYGATLLFTFAYGMGLILILIGASSGLLVSLPKSGKWMAYIKRTCALILIGAGLYFIYLSIGR